MNRITRLTESDLNRLVRRVVNEQQSQNNESVELCGDFLPKIKQMLSREKGFTIQADPKDWKYVIITPPSNFYDGQPCACLRNDILKID